MIRQSRWVILFALIGVVAASLPTGRARADEVVVTQRGQFATLADALVGAEDGERIDVYGGVHRGPIYIGVSIDVRGHDWPVIDGGATGSVVTISAPGVLLTGFEIRGSGVQLFEEDAAVQVNAPRARIEGNRIDDALFGIYLRESHDSEIRWNEITGKPLDPARRGDAIRLWSSHRVSIEGNTVRVARDVLISYSSHVQISGNTITGGRYGLHFMYCDDAVVERNRLTGNSVGMFMMYSRGLQLRDNVAGENRGPSGYGVGLKDVDNAILERNLFADNRVGAYVDNSPSEQGSVVRFESNVFVFNDFGLRLLPSVRSNEYVGNSFIDNGEQVEISGGGKLGANSWAVDGRGNYWSDYAGYDADGDGVGDIPYRSEKLFESLANRNPELRILSYSPSSQAVDFAARLAPFTKPTPKLVDPSPLIAPGSLPGQALSSGGTVVPVIASSLALLGFAISLGFLARKTPHGDGEHGMKPLPLPVNPIVSVYGLNKAYGRSQALTDVSFQVRAGEGLGLWGANGAGKTTVIRCLLGLISFDGTASIGGHDVGSEGKEARKLVGFVPQETGFAADASIDETIRFFGSVRGTGEAECDRLIDQMGLAEHRNKQVRQLSGGLRQRLAIATALLGDPPLLVMDEPTANLDAAGRQDILDVLRRLKWQGKTFILATHRSAEIAALADRVLLLKSGSVVDELAVGDFIEQSFGSTELHMTLAPSSIDRAIAVLEMAGFGSRRNGTGLNVTVSRSAKAAPVTAVIMAGISVIDLELKGGHGEMDDA
jgi:nitrous oxidase accessory protein